MTAGGKTSAGFLARVKTRVDRRRAALPDVKAAAPPPDPNRFPIVSGIERARARAPEQVIDVRPGQTYRRRPPVFANVDRLSPIERQRYEGGLYATVAVPAASVAAVGPATIFGSGYVKTPDGKLLSESISNVSEQDSGHNLGLVKRGDQAWWERGPIEPNHFVFGPVTTLCNLGGRVWGHWLFELLPRIDILRHHALFPRTKFVIPHSAFRSLIESLIACGVDAANIIEADDDAPIAVDNYLCVTPVLLNQVWIAPQNVAFIRDVGLRALDASRLRHGGPRGRRLFVTRGDAAYRKLLNQDAVADLLQTFGFETVTIGDMSFARQVAMFADIEAAIVVLGSGASNQVFSKPGTPIAYLAPASESTFYFLDVASMAGNPLAIVFGQVPAENVGRFADFVVDLDDLRAALAALGLGRR